MFHSSLAGSMIETTKEPPLSYLCTSSLHVPAPFTVYLSLGEAWLKR